MTGVQTCALPILKASPKPKPKPKPSNDVQTPTGKKASGASVEKAVLMLIGIPIGILLLCLILVVGLRMAGYDLPQITTQNNSNKDPLHNLRSDLAYASGYSAGHAYTKRSGEALAESSVPHHYRLRKINEFMDEVDATARKLAFQHGRDKDDEHWKEGCKEGLMDGIRNVRAKY